MKAPDQSPCIEITDGQKIVSYSMNSDGKYEMVRDYVCQPVDIFNRQAWREIEKRIDRSRRRVLAGKVSCLHYYMTANQMDAGLLAKYTGQSRLRVLLHLLPFVFRRLDAKTIKIYAELFKILSEDLVRGRLRSPIYKQDN
jgi:hypothetical protein